ncbi:ABC transporter permease [Pseudogemmobacter sonorensis]|uniref:ABC transporter permease n=1 Tax=Pseudogemmobacter sonorensis TaxID=2989681 RepID=UPI0036B68703
MTEPSIETTRTGFSVLRLLAAVPTAIWTLVLVLILWELAVWLLDLPPIMLPAPSAIAQEFVNYGHRLWPNTLFTAWEVFLGFICAILVGVPLATVIVYSPFLERATYPLIVSSQTVPMVAIAPLLLTWFGYGIAPKIVIVVLQAFFPIVINTVMGLKSVSDEMIHLARSMGATPWQLFWKFRLPAALPSLFAGLKMATAASVVGAIVAEFVGSSAGLGYVIVASGAAFNVTRQFAAIICITLLGIAFFAFLEWAERMALPWKKDHGAKGGH